MSNLTFHEVLEALEQFSVEQQESLAEILRHRLSDKRREEIARNAQITHKQFEAGKLPVGTVEDMVADLLRDET